MNDDPQMAQWTPEHPPRGVEEGSSEVQSMLNELSELTLLEGRVSAADFAARAIKEAERLGIYPEDDVVIAIMQHSFGSPDDARNRVAHLTEAEFSVQYPGDLGSMLCWYIDYL